MSITKENPAAATAAPQATSPERSSLNTNAVAASHSFSARTDGLTGSSYGSLGGGRVVVIAGNTSSVRLVSPVPRDLAPRSRLQSA